MSLPEIQRDAVKMMHIQSALKYIDLDPRVAKPVIDVQQYMLHILRDTPIEDFR